MEEGLSRRQTFGSHAQGRDREYNPAPRQPGSAATTKAAEKEGSGSGSGLSRMHVRTARILEVLMALDVSLLYVLYHEWPAVCDASGALKVWLLVGVIMGLPMSGMVSCCARRSTFRRAVCLELVFLVGAFVWLSAGSLWCWTSFDCVLEAPLLFWTVFVITVFVWTSLFTVIILLILMTVFVAMKKN
eukprot:TRINITY_DN60337_c0_g1_i1.p1 TRINITY_DN60337_c0_g1~~TRINITY_DN60337_c0_g1_i1.p1  ORF type:complete len:188 (-),score=49.65 TRINITY_DN60337_c0_g1_i1:107-670(-)